MPAFLIADIEVRDEALYKDYRERVPATVAKFGGRFIVRGGRSRTVEGAWSPRRLVVIEFPDMAALEAWYHSPDYAPLIDLRRRAADGSLVMVEGV